MHACYNKVMLALAIKQLEKCDIMPLRYYISILIMKFLS
jgi:hypothetical protein